MFILRRVSYVSFVMLFLSRLFFFPHLEQSGIFIVGTGTPESCNETTFQQTLELLNSSNGGTMIFKCGPQPHTIFFFSKKDISRYTDIQGDDLITFSGAHSVPLFHILQGGSLTLTRITLMNGQNAASGGAIENEGALTLIRSKITNNDASAYGGAIYNTGTLMVSNTLFANNQAMLGGGIYSGNNTANINDSRFTGNKASSHGGAIYLDENGSMDISGSQFTGNAANRAEGQGGAIYSKGTLTIKQSSFDLNSADYGGAIAITKNWPIISQTTIIRNWAFYGGGIYKTSSQNLAGLTLADSRLIGNGYGPNGSKIAKSGGAIQLEWGEMTIVNVTLSGNWAALGGGFFGHHGFLTPTNMTISGNTADKGGGIYTDGTQYTLMNATIVGNSAAQSGAGIEVHVPFNESIMIKNSLLSDNRIIGTLNSQNCLLPSSVGRPYNLSSDGTCGFGAGRDSLSLPLGPLANNGGFGQTHLLPPGSPAIDGGTDDRCPAADQRGVPRPQGQHCDVGAVEVRASDYVQVRLIYIPTVLR